MIFLRCIRKQSHNLCYIKKFTTLSLQMDTFIDISMAIGPVLGYLHQYYIISKSKTIGSFSIDICGILLFANILRLNFYVFTKYATALLWQSINMIVVQICLVYICTKYKKKNIQDNESQVIGQVKDNTETLSKFWRWHQFSTYLISILFFTFITFSITLTFKEFQFEAYGVFVGLTALLSESILIVPQIIRNFKKKCTQGLSYLLVAFNLFGDIFKLVYFIINKQAFQFIICGIVQVCLDTFVIFQIYLYRKNTLIQQKDHKSMQEKNEYDINDVLKTDTEKNLDEVEMNEKVMVKGSFQERQTDEYYESQRNTQAKQNNEQYVYMRQWGMKFRSRVQKKDNEFEIQHDQSVHQQNQITKQKEENSKQNKQINQNQPEQSNPHIHKALSYQNQTIPSQNQLFQIQYSVPSKSMQNVKVQG